MNLQRHVIKACCGKMAYVFKIDQPLSKQHLDDLVKIGFKELPHFTKAGIIYVENTELIVTGPIGSNKLQVKCRKSNETDCMKIINNFELSLQNIA